MSQQFTNKYRLCLRSLALVVILAGMLIQVKQISGSIESAIPVGVAPTAESFPLDAQIETYTEDFSSYTYKAYTDRADWNVFNQALTILPTSGGAHRESAIAPDGRGGAYVVWQDKRHNQSDANWDIYAQCIDGHGNRLWAADLRVNSDDGNMFQGNPLVETDSLGNAVVAWVDDRDQHGAKAVYAQKITSDGTKLWPEDIRVNSLPSYRAGWGVDSFAMAVDSQDSLVVAWQGIWEGNWADPDIHAQKIGVNGQRVWANDVQVNQDVGHRQTSVALDVANQDEIVFAWVDERNGGQDLYAQRLDTDAQRLWAEDVKISSGSAIPNRGNPNVVTDSLGNAVIVWRSGPQDPPLDDRTSDILAQRVGANGELLWSGDRRVNLDTSHVFRGHPRAALAPSDRVLVVWEDARRGFELGTVDVYSQLVSPSGATLWSADQRINPEDWKNWNLKPRLRIENGLAWIVWGTDDNVYTQILDIDSVALKLPLPSLVNEVDGKVDQIGADISLLGNDRVLVAWHAVSRHNRDIRIQILDLDGNTTWPVSIQVNDTDLVMKRQRLKIASNVNNLSLVAWQDEQGGIYGHLVSEYGIRLWDRDLRIDSHGRQAYNPSVAAPGGGSFAVAWIERRQPSTDLWDVYLQRIDTEGNRLWTSDVRVNLQEYHLADVDARSTPQVVIDREGHLVVAWRGGTGGAFDVFVRRFSPDGSPDWPDDVALNVHLLSLTGRFQDRLFAAIAGNEITVASASSRDGLSGVYLQRLDLDGRFLWSPGAWASSSPEQFFYGNPSLALADDGGVVVVWDEEPGLRDVYAQRLGSDGSLLWPTKIRLNDTLAWPLHPALSNETENSFIAVWNDERYGDNSIYARRFADDGTLLWDDDLALIAGEHFYTTAGTAESLAVDNTLEDITQVSLLVSQVPNGGLVEYHLTNDGGHTWEEAVPGSLHQFGTTGSDLRWQAILRASTDGLRSPTVQNVTLRHGHDLVGDAYEPDNSCAQSMVISTDGTLQQHVFHQQADADWVTFEAVSGTTYLIGAEVPPESPADIVLELHDQCSGLPVDTQDYTFTNGARMEYKATASGPLFLKLINHSPAVYGSHVIYHLSVRALSDESTPGALVLVAGRLRLSDTLQDNIHNVTNAVYRLFSSQGYDHDRIYYLATDLNLDADGDKLSDVDALVSKSYLQAAITSWAAERVGSDQPFTLYMMDHGSYDRFYLDGPRGERVSPRELHDWLTQLEMAAPGVKVNVIIEACHSGSFIDLTQSVSKPGRVVITSTGAWTNAWRSQRGAIFSDHFLAALGRSESLYAGFLEGRDAAQHVNPSQEAWLDDTGDGIPNTWADGEEAARRGFAYAGTLPDHMDRWPPHIVQATVPGGIDQGEGVIRAEVRDNQAVHRVWAVIYRPSYEPPPVGEELVHEDLPTIVLWDQGDDWYGATYSGFDEAGTYRVVIHAEDEELVEARPLAIEVNTGEALHFPLIFR